MSGSSSFPSISIFSQSEKVGTLAFIARGKIEVGETKTKNLN